MAVPERPWQLVKASLLVALVALAGTVPVAIPPTRYPAAYWVLTGVAVAVVGLLLLYLVFWWDHFGTQTGRVIAVIGLVGTAGSAAAAVALGTPPSLTGHYPVISAGVLALVLLVFRGSPWLAWACFGGISVSVVLVARALGFTGWLGVAYPLALGTTFLVVTAAAVTLHGMLGELSALKWLHRDAASRTRSARAAASRRSARIERLSVDVGPLLSRVAQGRELTAQDLREARLLELGLRDGIRGAVLDTPEIGAVVRGARERGVGVTLLDDGGLAAFPEREAQTVLSSVTELVVGELAALPAGKMVVRVLPPGREPAALITVDAEGAPLHRWSVRSDGTTAPTTGG